MADTGAFDILGNPNGEAMLAKTVWQKADKPLIGVQPVNHSEDDLIKAAWRGTNAIPSWSWCGCEGNMATVEIYSEAAHVELFLNGKSMGKKEPESYSASYQLPYEPGKLEVVAYDKEGVECGRNCLESVTGNMALAVVPEEKRVKAGDIVYVDLAVVGKNGIVESNRDMQVDIEVINGTLLALGSANPRTEERYDTGTCTTYYGRAQAVVQAGVSGTVVIKAGGEKGFSCYDRSRNYKICRELG